MEVIINSLCNIANSKRFIFLTAPLVNIRKGMTKIKAEITEMDVRIGVLESMLLQSRLREAKLLEEDLANPLSAR